MPKYSIKDKEEARIKLLEAFPEGSVVFTSVSYSSKTKKRHTVRLLSILIKDRCMVRFRPNYQVAALLGRRTPMDSNKGININADSPVEAGEQIVKELSEELYNDPEALKIEWV